MSPSGLPGRSGVGPWMGMNVGSLPSATPLGWAARVGAAAGALVAAAAPAGAVVGFAALAAVGAAGGVGLQAASNWTRPRPTLVRRKSRRLCTGEIVAPPFCPRGDARRGAMIAVSVKPVGRE